MTITSYSLPIIKLHDGIILTMVQRNLWVPTIDHREIVIIMIARFIVHLLFLSLFEHDVPGVVQQAH